MSQKSHEFKAAMIDVREKIAAAKRHGASRGFIGYHGCCFVCNSFIDILEDAGKVAQRGDYTFAYSATALILINLAKLASTADDSAGGITDARYHVEKILEKICSHVKHGSNEAEYIYLQSIKDCQNKAFNDWDEFAYDLLLKTARLATNDNKQKMYDAANNLYKKASSSAYSSWADEFDARVRLEIINATADEADVNEFIKTNLKYDAIRRIAVNNAISAQKYECAEKLCLEKLCDDNTLRREYSRPSEWRYLLFEIYDKSDDAEKKIQTAKELLLRFDTKYFDVLKELITKKGTWESEYTILLESLKQRLPPHIYMEILSKENEINRLLEEVGKHPLSVFDYGDKLAAHFASQTYTICLSVIRDQANDANSRNDYKKVCSLIKKLFKFGGITETENIIIELKTKFPRRPAMLEELDALRMKLFKVKRI